MAANFPVEGRLWRTPPATAAVARGVVTAAAVALAVVAAVLALGAMLGLAVVAPVHPYALDLACLAALLALGPYAVLDGFRLRRRRAMEERLPDFLRDLAVSRRAGLTLPAAVTAAAEGDYGPLTPEIRKLAAALKWNQPFAEAFDDLARRIPTAVMARAAALVRQASETGGNVSEVLLAAARDARTDLVLRRERRSGMSIYAAIVYVAFGVFLLVAAALYATLVPHLLAATDAASSLGGPFRGGAASLADFRTFYFVSALVQAVGNGTLLGALGGTGFATGARHACIMTATAWVAFLALG